MCYSVYSSATDYEEFVFLGTCLSFYKMTITGMWWVVKLMINIRFFSYLYRIISWSIYVLRSVTPPILQSQNEQHFTDSESRCVRADPRQIWKCGSYSDSKQAVTQALGEK